MYATNVALSLPLHSVNSTLFTSPRRSPRKIPPCQSIVSVQLQKIWKCVRRDEKRMISQASSESRRMLFQQEIDATASSVGTMHLVLPSWSRLEWGALKCIYGIERPSRV